MSERRLCEGGCGRWLKSPESIARRYGKQCAERLGIAPAPSGPRRPRPVPRPDTPPEPIPGQVEIPLTHFQPTLESL